MKKIGVFFKILSSCFLLLNCDPESKEFLDSKANSNQNSNGLRINSLNSNDFKEVNFKGLIGIIQKMYPEELFELTNNEIVNVALNKSQKKFYKVEGINGNSLTEIINFVYKKYPNFDKFDAIEYQKYFPKLSINEINKNSENILEFTEKLMGFEVASAFSQLKNAKFQIDRLELEGSKRKKTRGYISAGTWINDVCTIGVVLAHLRLDISGLWDAVDAANNQSGINGNPTTNGGSNDRMDALRHGLWGIYLGKYGTWRYGDKDYAKNIIRALLNAHECGNSGISEKMDLHSNEVALEYYINHVVQTGPWWNRNTHVNESEEDIVNEIKNYPVEFL